MITEILIGLGVAFAVYWTIRTKKTFPMVITLGMVVGILAMFVSSRTLQSPGLYIYMGFVVVAFIYGLTVKEMKMGSRFIVCLMSASIFVYWLWVVNHWHGNAVLAPIVTLIVGLAALISDVKLRNEWGFLALLTVDAVAIILENWMKAG